MDRTELLGFAMRHVVDSFSIACADTAFEVENRDHAFLLVKVA
jgi:hypothetical protein